MAVKNKYCGSAKKFDIYIEFLDAHSIPYLLKESGNMKTIILDDKIRRNYIDKDIYKTPSHKIMQCCKEVNADVKNFTLSAGKIKCPDVRHVYVDEACLSHQLLKNKITQISLVDISHCYWRILFNHQIITEKTYEKWKGIRDARIVAVGNLKKPTRLTMKKSDGGVVRDTVINKNQWVWLFVSFKSNQAIQMVREVCDKEVFAYNTDGVYLPNKHAQKAQDFLNSINLPAKKTVYNIIGIDGNACVLQNTETGIFKKTNLGKASLLRGILQDVDFEELKKQNIKEIKE